MAKKKSMAEIDLPSRRATSQEERESMLINAAYDLAEKQIREGTASSQTINHFLKMGSERERTEREILRTKRELMNAQKESIESQQKEAELYERLLKEMRRYSGVGEDDDEDEDYEDEYID